MKEGSALAAIDIGSNSILLETARMEHGHIRLQLHRKETIRLGGALDADGRLQPEAMERGWDCLQRYAQLIAHVPPAQRKVVATQTLREATNRQIFLDRTASIVQCPVEVITGEQEAQLIYQGVALFLPDDQHPRLVVDIGGRSTELGWGQGNALRHASSYPLGSVGWAQAFFPDGTLSATAFAQARDAALSVLAPALPLADQLAAAPNAQVYGASGTAGAISKVLTAQGHTPGSISREALWALRDQLQSWGHVRHLASLQGLRPELLPVIGGGISVMCAVFELLGLQQMRMAQGALRHGLLVSLSHAGPQNG
ncbi:Ppx/GppA family phosphatase [Comamonas terrigena]|uniref:Ppx/GppA family phosphatase n=1 Tax=Comamonas terrigena TaxID=32013 RepID=UPI00244AA0E0|nr:Ppx/GppA family phosphatase [Comamonas terrigena]MDH1702511.1 Ppx/GppA family phosphatase [Comamonas terrigena]